VAPHLKPVTSREARMAVCELPRKESGLLGCQSSGGGAVSVRRRVAFIGKKRVSLVNASGKVTSFPRNRIQKIVFAEPAPATVTFAPHRPMLGSAGRARP